MRRRSTATSRSASTPPAHAQSLRRGAALRRGAPQERRRTSQLSAAPWGPISRSLMCRDAGQAASSASAALAEPMEVALPPMPPPPLVGPARSAAAAARPPRCQVVACGHSHHLPSCREGERQLGGRRAARAAVGRQWALIARNSRCPCPSPSSTASGTCRWRNSRLRRRRRACRACTARRRSPRRARGGAPGGSEEAALGRALPGDVVVVHAGVHTPVAVRECYRICVCAAPCTASVINRPRPRAARHAVGRVRAARLRDPQLDARAGGGQRHAAQLRATTAARRCPQRATAATGGQHAGRAVLQVVVLHPRAAVRGVRHHRIQLRRLLAQRVPERRLRPHLAAQRGGAPGRPRLLLLLAPTAPLKRRSPPPGSASTGASSPAARCARPPPRSAPARARAPPPAAAAPRTEAAARAQLAAASHSTQLGSAATAPRAPPARRPAPAPAAAARAAAAAARQSPARARRLAGAGSRCCGLDGAAATPSGAAKRSGSDRQWRAAQPPAPPQPPAVLASLPAHHAGEAHHSAAGSTYQ